MYSGGSKSERVPILDGPKLFHWHGSVFECHSKTEQNHSKTEQKGGHFVQTIWKLNTIQNPNTIRNQTFKMFGFRMDSEFEWLEFKPQLYLAIFLPKNWSHSWNQTYLDLDMRSS